MKKAYKNDLLKDVKYRIKFIVNLLKITVFALAAFMLVLVVSLIIDVSTSTIKYTLEAGAELPSAEVLSGRTGASYDFGEESGSFDVPGEYIIYIIRGSRKTAVKLTVVDTTPPKAEVVALSVAKGGPIPSAIDFFKDVEDVSRVTAKFKQTVNMTELDKPYEVKIELSDEYGNKRNYSTSMTMIIDTEAPRISAPASITGYVGEAVAYRKAVVVTDNCFGEIELDVDSSRVDTKTAGSYKVIYTAKDKSGNTSRIELTVNILKERITKEQLMEKIEALASELGIKKSMTKEEQVKGVYAYVNSPKMSAGNANVVFTNESNTDRSDWIREAYITLQRGSGDCYSYFAVSKAFFEYFGIDNLDIQRAAGVTTQSGTHFWSMVNIGTDNKPMWYYYDATRLKKQHNTGSGCLFTEGQLEDYDRNVNVGFLTFDHTGYPEASNDVINKNYTW